MRITLCLAILLVACTNKNPNLCCIDAADCEVIGLPDVTGCDDGLICRGNQCIAEVCEASTECDASAPYCVAPPDGRCQETCSDDSECPGFGQSVEQSLCEGGSCVQCRTNADCSATTPVCDTGLCVSCSTNDQCSSGACAVDGTCADESMVAYVALTGTAGGECSSATPCTTIEFALALGRPFVVIDSGTYSRPGTLSLSGRAVRLIGRGPTLPIIRRNGQGPIISVANSATIGLERLEISGAVGTGEENDNGGHGVLCTLVGGVATINILDSALHGNFRGLQARRCTVTATRTRFVDNVDRGINVVDTTGTFDRCTVANLGEGASLDAGVYIVTNSFFVRNGAAGLNLFLGTTGSRVEFNTFVDNGVGFACSAPSTSFPNNIIARNGTQISSFGCTFPNSIIIDADITPLNFISPDVAPFDYHIQAGSMAIDMATITTNDHDFDGDARASDSADVGADEL